VQLVSFTGLHLTDYNMATGKGVFAADNGQHEAELFFYLQGQDCLGIRLGRHDQGISTQALEDYLAMHKTEIRRQIQPVVEELREEGRQQLMQIAM
jgi:hypothetical protein